ncbi:AAA family ATPase [Rhodoblastus sp.]|uniref:bifunctional aminoglycoside phosphotransferase/ATP-binding protein n=1 Tax=Rhodoblastus sp. TaxID=1962975 RepID=UPI003F9C6957
MDQSATIAFLMASLAREAGAEISCKQTHVSLLFLAGDLVFKLKRAVAFPYLDFSSPQLREKACRAELALNSRAAPNLYLGVRRITLEGRGLAFDGQGEMVDSIVVMRRFAESDLFDVMARENRLTPRHIEALAETLARFHANAERFPEIDGAGTMAHLLDLNAISFSGSPIFPHDEVVRLNQVFRAELDRLAPLLDARSAAGFVRLCHGDLYLRNICMFEGRPTLFDCIEFDERLARIDVLYDVAFTLMDLWMRGRRDLANLLFNRYASALFRTLADLPARIRDGFATLPFFMALRAAIRAHIAASQAHSGDEARDAAHKQEALAYFALAADLLAPCGKILIAIGGLSGSGKSTLAAALAAEIGPPPGARTLNSDRTRKAMHRIRPTDRLPQSAYEFNITAAVYLRLMSRAMDALAQGSAVIVDAVYSTEDERAAIAQVAREKNVPFVGLWLEADPEILRQRVRERPQGPSDADVSVLEAQLQRDPGRIDWFRLNSAAPDLKDQALAILRAALAKSAVGV